MQPKIIDEPTLRDKRFIFKDRLHAGELLAAKLEKYSDRDDVQLLAIPAGGVPVGYVIASELNLPLDVIIIRKIQIPWDTEAGFGALSWDGTTILNTPLVRRLGLSDEAIRRALSMAQENILNRVRKFRGDRSFPKLEHKIALLVDDGLASGFTMLVAAESAKKSNPEEIVVGVPTASLSSAELVARSVDELVCLNIRSGPTFAVADAYQEWHDLSDEEVMEWLNKASCRG